MRTRRRAGFGSEADSGSEAALRSEAAFTLIEIMAVVLIIGLLTTGVGIAVAGIIEDARANTSRTGIRTLEAAVQMYQIDNGRYPTTDQGLQALIEKPTIAPEPRRWRKGGYLAKPVLPKDGWGEPFQYASPGTHNAGGFDLWSLGPDGVPGADDIGNWAEEESG